MSGILVGMHFFFSVEQVVEEDYNLCRIATLQDLLKTCRWSCTIDDQLRVHGEREKWKDVVKLRCITRESGAWAVDKISIGIELIMRRRKIKERGRLSLQFGWQRIVPHVLRPPAGDLAPI